MAGHGQTYVPVMDPGQRDFIREQHRLKKAALDAEKQRRASRTRLQKFEEDFRKWQPFKARTIRPEQTTSEPVQYDQWDLIGEDYKTTDLTHYQKKVFKKQGFSFKEKIGEGAYGQVWRCKQKVSLLAKRPLACKIIALKAYERSGLSVSQSVAAILQESKLLQRLSHRNIVQIGDVLQHEDEVTGFRGCHVFQFMELCEGSLDDLIRSLPAQQMTEAEAMEWFKDVAQGVQYLHQNNVSHMDLKLENVLYTTDKTTNTRVFKLTDFGMAKYFNANDPSISIDFVGTPMFMAPEIGKGPYDTKSADIFSLGITLAASLCFSTMDPISFVNLMHRWSFAVANQYGVDAACSALLVDMCRKRPTDRFDIDQVLDSDWLLYG